jgi:hypothetical protein
MVAVFLPGILKGLGYAEHSFVNWYWCLLECSVADCLLPMRCDVDIIRMNNILSQHKNLRIYIDHSNFIERQRRQTKDLLDCGTSSEPPTIISPKKITCHYLKFI